MKIVLAAFAMSLCCACSPTASDVSPQEDKEINFACDNGESLTVRFVAKDDAAILNRAGDLLELKRQPGGPEVSYSNGTTTLRRNGDGLNVQIGRMAAMECKPK